MEVRAEFTWPLLCRNKLVLNQPLDWPLDSVLWHRWRSSQTAIFKTGVRCLYEVSRYGCADRGWGCATGVCPTVRIARRLLRSRLIGILWWLLGPLRIGISWGLQSFRTQSIRSISPLFRQRNPRLPESRQFQRSSTLYRSQALSQAIHIDLWNGSSLRYSRMDRRLSLWILRYHEQRRFSRLIERRSR
jgi:hypothetical protein